MASELSILRLPKVVKRTGLSRSTIYERIAEGNFPKPIRLGGGRGGAVGWTTESIQVWIKSQVEVDCKTEARS